MNPFLMPFATFAQFLNLFPGVSATVREAHVEVTDDEAPGRRVLLVRGRDPERARQLLAASRASEDPRKRAGGPTPLVRFDIAPEGDHATLVVDDPDATVSLEPGAVAVTAAGVDRRFDLPFDPSGSERRVSNGVLTVDIE